LYASPNWAFIYSQAWGYWLSFVSGFGRPQLSDSSIVPTLFYIQPCRCIGNPLATHHYANLTNDNRIDINENDLSALGDGVLEALLLDHTTHRNIFWATSDYENEKGKGKGYDYHDPILPHLITGDNCRVVMPRVLKRQQQQSSRTRDMAEVFTPSWVCNLQNNLIDEAWFGRPDVFNVTSDADGHHTWQPTPGPITFPQGKTWHDYVCENRLEITCGEAPYLVSRYDTTTGEPIAVGNRIGMLDRKLRIVAENTDKHTDWYHWAKIAIQSTYGYEWQGDSLLLAREALLYTFIDYYRAKFHKKPRANYLRTMAYFISWNLWQMDGLKGVIPDSCHAQVVDEEQLSIWDCTRKTTMCPGCLNDDITKHNGIQCLIRDWKAQGDQQRITFISLLTNDKNNKPL